jgi:hypothetical protein
MKDQTWPQVIARLSADDPVDLDPVLGGFDTGPVLPALPLAAEPTVLSARLWQRNDTVSHIGIRVDSPPSDLRRLALRLASAAVERGVIPIILSSLPRTGFEPYGFRVERLPDGPPEAVALFEAELRLFWDMPIVIDLADVERLG